MTTGIASPIAVAGLAGLDGFDAMAAFHCISGVGVKLTFANTVSVGCAAGLAGGGIAGLAGAALATFAWVPGGGGSCGWAGFSQNANQRCVSGTGCLVYCVFTG